MCLLNFLLIVVLSLIVSLKFLLILLYRSSKWAELEIYIEIFTSPSSSAINLGWWFSPQSLNFLVDLS